MNAISGGVTAAKGFKASGCAAGIKKNGQADMALVVSETLCAAAGTFTTNVVKAAPVLWDKEVVGKGAAQAVVVNAGIANACTGEEGCRYCLETAEEAADALRLSAAHVLVASTGVIGQQLPIDKIRAGVRALAGMTGGNLEDGLAAAKAIMTTDTVPKEAAFTAALSDGSVVTVGGCAKGSGMIHPNMCTMLAFITTDAAIAQPLLQKALSSAVPDTFNMVSVDGDTSTNDTCVVLANGMAGNAVISEENADYEAFREALFAVCESLAKQMAKDGEGATCLFECRVINAPSKEAAKTLARSVVSSTLTKAAIAGHDANWGRILCALGYAGVPFDPMRVSLSIESAAGSLVTYEMGVPLLFDEEKATEILSANEIRAVADMHDGIFAASAFGCDLTHEYVNINADYRS